MYEVLLTHEAQRFYKQADPVLVRQGDCQGDGSFDNKRKS
jgi:hypothetical protein